MNPPIASLLVTVSLALSAVLATPSAADPQLDELSEVRAPLDAPGETDNLSEATAQLDAMSEALNRRLSERVDEMLTELASKALEEQIERLTAHSTGRSPTRVAKAPGDNMTCSVHRDSMLRCVVVAMRSPEPVGSDFAAAKP